MSTLFCRMKRGLLRPLQTESPIIREMAGEKQRCSETDGDFRLSEAIRNTSSGMIRVRSIPGMSFGNRYYSRNRMQSCDPDNLCGLIRQEILWRTVPRKCLNDLLSRPLGRRISGHVEMNNFTTTVAENYQHKQNPECGGGNSEKID